MNINSNIPDPKKLDLQRFSEHAFSTEMAVGAIVASAKTSTDPSRLWL
jgi:hypothetical protein